MKIQELTDVSFGRYGKVVNGISFDKILKEMEHTPLPKDVVYVPSVETLEALPEIIETIQAMEDTVLLPITDETSVVQHIQWKSERQEASDYNR